MPKVSIKVNGQTVATVPAGAIGPDRSGLAELAGYMKKKSGKGAWQSRWFRTNNHFLTYQHKQKPKETAVPACCYDLRCAFRIETIGRFGHVEMEMKFPNAPATVDGEDDGIRTIELKAKNLEEAEKWVDGLVERRNLFQMSLYST